MEKRYEELSHRLDGFDATMKELREEMKLLLASCEMKNNNNGNERELDHNESIKLIDILFGICNRCFKFTNEEGASSSNTQSDSKDKVDPTNNACFNNLVISSSSESATVVDKNMLEDMKDSFTYENVMERFHNFMKFDTVSDHSDHFYSKHTSLPEIESRQKAWHIRIKKDLRDLKIRLPVDILVRAYEGRIDLLRAVVIGPKETPYHDGLFFFDVCFPKTYPNTQPLVWYDSRGHFLNPNLYISGDVSLVFPKNMEELDIWEPGTSNMLTFLVFLKNLFNKMPLLNNIICRMSIPYDELDALIYNQNTFIKSLKTPKHFEDFVVGHFRSRAADILKACEAYSEGVQIGCLVRGRPYLSKGTFSITFNDDLEACCEPLIVAFDRIGVFG